MKVLLDTCALAELRHPRGNPAVKAAIDRVPDDFLYISALTLGELTRGMALLADGRKKRALSSWLIALKSQFVDRVLPVDGEIAYLWGDLAARARLAGLGLPVVDGLLAATALSNGLHIMTHHTLALAATGARIIDPWREAEGGNDGK
jgi:predicted nucleic acid-binding protein